MVKLRDNTVPNLLKQGALRSRGYNDVPLHLGPFLGGDSTRMLALHSRHMETLRSSAHAHIYT